MIGILLAAGFSRRFGTRDKLLHALSDGRPIALAAAQNLVRAVPAAIAIVRPDNRQLGDLLRAEGLRVVACAAHEQDMAASLAAAVHYASALPESAGGFVIALGDMPFIRPATITAVAQTLSSGAAIVVPEYHNRRGHPVAFAAQFRNELQHLHGDEGARAILQRYPGAIRTLACDDPGILTDIDTLADLMPA